MFRVFVLIVCVAISHALVAPLYKKETNVHGHYAIKLKDHVNVDEIAQRFADNPFFQMFGGKIGRRFYTAVKGFAAELPGRALELLRQSPDVEFVEEEAMFKINSVASWGLDRVDQPDLPLDDIFEPIASMGEGVNIYIIDTGVTPTHNDVVGRCFIGIDMTGKSEEYQGYDCHGHGSHCSGTAAGTTYGIAKKAHIYGVRVLSCVGFGVTTWITGGCDFVAQNHIAPAVASMSLGGVASEITDAAIRGMVNAGVTVSVAAGNEDTDACLRSPAREELAITAGASDNTDTRAYFSNFGECVDIFAPGVSITSIWYETDDATYVASGTSMACPHVTGAAALVLGEDPNKSPGEVKAALLNSAVNNRIIDSQSPVNKLLQVLK